MSRAPRATALVAVVALPVGAALGTYLLVSGPEPPQVPGVVRIGEGESVPRTSGNTGPRPAPSTDRQAPSTQPSNQPPTKPTTRPNTRTHIPPPPPVDDDDDGDDDADDGPDDG
ncbi:MAG: small secreted hydrophilic protein [Pseudonocardiaceae bacterium]|nr:small secreted hydrophilic protein [Pseudonocardiaceae bacterium]